MSKLLKLEPEFKHRIWGGTRLQEIYGFDTPIKTLGETWIITSLVNNADNKILSEKTTLNELYQNHRELFGTDDDICPIKGMIIASEKDLSIQVHPDDEYAKVHDNSHGKPEAWYIIDAKEGAKIEFGHSAASKEELKQKIEDGKWDELLTYVYPKKGDFLYVPHGVMHALGKDLLVYEISKNADLTYRVYDYDRVDPTTGTKRELHIQKSLDVLKAPVHETGLIHPQAEQVNGIEITTYFDEPKMFTFKKLVVKEQGTYEQEMFGFYFVNEGSGTINNQAVKKGETYFVSKDSGVLSMKGDMELLLSTYRAK